MTALLQVSQVEKSFASVAGAPPTEVLRGIDLTIEAGESLAVVGASGSGKSTLLNVIGALDVPTRGTVRLGGVDLSGLDADGLAAVRNSEVGFVFQAHHLLPQLTALENVLVPTLVAGKDVQDGALERARRLLGVVGLGDRLDHRPAQLSGGECQRVAVVRALINGPKLLLADEPTGSLDSASAAALGELLLDLNRDEGVALVVVTHSDALAESMARRVVIRDGKLE